MKFGLYQMCDLHDPMVVASAERELQTPVHLLSFYRAWNNAHIDDDLAWLTQILRAPRLAMLTWEPWRLPGQTSPADQPHYALKQIFSGQYDPYIRDVARTIKSLGRPLLLRPMHEMNGNWYPWCGTVNGNQAGDYVKAWRHLHRLFAQENVRQVKWVWSPYVASFPDVPDNQVEHYFPGDDFIDCLALDGFNWGSSQSWSHWQSFEELFTPAYDRLAALSSRPIMVGEMGCSESGGNKPSWIREAARVLSEKMPRIETVFWFNENKECDWRLQSSAAASKYFRSYWAYSDKEQNSCLLEGPLPLH